MGIIQEIKNSVKKSGSNKGKIVYFGDGEKKRIRFLQEMDTGTKFLQHENFESGLKMPCRITFGEDCDYCEMEDVKHRDFYLWQVYDYEAKEVKLLYTHATPTYSPVSLLVDFYDTYGTIIDRDYVITKKGKQLETNFSVVPMDKVKFKLAKVKLYSQKKTLDILNKAFPTEEDLVDDDSDEDEEDEVVTKKSKSNKKPTKKAAKKVVEPEEDEDDNYEGMTTKELFLLCKERDIACKPKKDADYYINLLEDDDDNEEEDEDEDENEWD